MIHENIELTGSFTVSGSFVLPNHSTTASLVEETGSMYHDTVDGVLKVYTGTQWVTVGEQTAPAAPLPSIEYLLVAGGGGNPLGGNNGAGNGGGGGGGFISSSYSNVTSGSSFTITIGAGTTTSGGDSTIASDTFANQTAIGGGEGGSGRYANAGSGTAQTGKDGGSGGGGGNATSGDVSGGAATTGQGNAGGSGVSNEYAGGGGGGAGSAGSNAASSTGGNGGDGLQSSITGTATYYAGGGGGGTYGGTAGTGGAGGGTDGKSYGGGQPSNGTANTGGGAGGLANKALSAPSGGSGVAIFAYPTSSLSGLGGIKTKRSDGYMVHTFNSSGTLTIAGAGEYPFANGSEFAPVIYTGNGSTQAITSVGFQPDLVWIKARDNGSNNHLLTDSIRGVGVTSSVIGSNLALVTNYNFGHISSFDSNGFTVAQGSVSGNYVNSSSATYVAWCWKAGGTAVSNTSGTITSQVSANQAAGFSIVKYTGQAAARTVGHGLSTTPELVLIKNLDDSRNWVVYHKDLSASSYIFLNLGNAQETDTRTNGGQPRPFGPFTSTTFGVNIDNETGHTNDYIAYCFHSVEGYQKVGSYTGNGSSTGPIVTTGFRPRFIMTKPSTAADNWTIWDNVRETGDDIDRILVPNTANSETADGFGRYDITLSSTGFQIKQTDGQINTNGVTYIYLAIA